VEPVGQIGDVGLVARKSIAAWVERLDALDALSEPLQQGARRVIPQGSQLKDVLSGTWLGHPLHPPLTDVVVGTWTSALLLDLLGGERSEEAADGLVAAGVIAAVPTAAAGLSDWAELRGPSRRVGFVHALGNVTALLLHVLSLGARRRGDRSRAVGLSMFGYAVASGSAWLGGHLSFVNGVGVNQTAFDDAPKEWTPVLDEADLVEGKLVGARAETLSVLLLRKGDHLYALDDRCSHRGCSLHEGTLNDDSVTCPCHGSTFRFDGTIVKGPATAPQPAFDVRADGSKIEIRATSS
jgi:nitrite reductase/ring-hydroxylating ferredoxin subunit/uncharacterized membrane protein